MAMCVEFARSFIGLRARSISLAKLRPPKLEKRYKEVLSVPEMERHFAELNPKTFLSARMSAILALLYDSGLRAGELCGIDIGDIDWDGYQVRVIGKGGRSGSCHFLHRLSDTSGAI